MACVRNRRGKWTLDYRDQDGEMSIAANENCVQHVKASNITP